MSKKKSKNARKKIVKPIKVKPEQKCYTVWISQVNQMAVEVKATDLRDASEKGYRKWRREYAHSYVTQVVQQPPQ